MRSGGVASWGLGARWPLGRADERRAVGQQENPIASLKEQIEATQGHFSRIFLGGIPQLLNDDGAYLSFVCVFAGVEALAGFRYPDKENGERFREFIRGYFETQYHPFLNELWDLRNSLVHSFSPAHFVLCHHQSHRHFADNPPYLKVLNAEDLYAALVAASGRYFQDLREDSSLQALFERRAKSSKGGLLHIRT